MLQIGDKLPEFNLIGFDNKMHSNFEFAEKYALVVIFTCDSSEYSKAYSKRIVDLFERYEDDNLGIVGINSNDGNQSPEDSLAHMTKAAQRFGLDNYIFYI